jgi:hypothetical protein
MGQSHEVFLVLFCKDGSGEELLLPMTFFSVSLILFEINVLDIVMVKPL